MEVKISKKLNDIYNAEHKNMDYEIEFVLDSLDPVSYKECFSMVKTFDLQGSKCVVSIGNNIVDRVLSDLELDEVDDNTFELLLWIGAALPEV